MKLTFLIQPFFELDDPSAIGLLPISKAVCAGSSRLFSGKKGTNPEKLDARRRSNSICLFLVLFSNFCRHDYFFRTKTLNEKFYNLQFFIKLEVVFLYPKKLRICNTDF